MSEDEKMFKIGLGALGVMLVLTSGLQVCYRTQDRTRNHVRSEIVKTQQKIAEAQTVFEGYKRPEVLRNLVSGVVPNAVAVGYQKSVSIDELKERQE